MGNTLALFILESRLTLVEVKQIKKEQGGCKVVVLSGKGMNESYGEKFTIQFVKSETSRTARMKHFDILWCFVCSGHECRQSFITLFTNAEEGIIGIENAPGFCCKWMDLSFIHIAAGSPFNSFTCTFWLSSMASHSSPLAFAVFCFQSSSSFVLVSSWSSWSIWIGRLRLKMQTINILP